MTNTPTLAHIIDEAERRERACPFLTILDNAALRRFQGRRSARAVVQS
jgi:hypothetical protein